MVSGSYGMHSGGNLGVAVILAAGPPTGQGGGWLPSVLVVLVALAAWAVSLWRHPFTICRTCKGVKVNPGSTDKRFGFCPGCGGSGRRQRPGVRVLHRVAQSATTRWQKDRARRRQRRVEQRTRNPREIGGK